MLFEKFVSRLIKHEVLKI